MPEPMKFIVHWDNIDRKVRDLAARLDNKKPDLIIGLGRGGLVPAVMLSHHLEVPMEALMWQTRDGDFRSLNHLHDALVLHSYREGERILIVDDINDTGRAMLDITKIVEERAQLNNWTYTYETAVLFERDTSAFKADYVAEQLEDDRWIQFPWEV